MPYSSAVLLMTSAERPKGSPYTSRRRKQPPEYAAPCWQFFSEKLFCQKRIFFFRAGNFLIGAEKTLGFSV